MTHTLRQRSILSILFGFAVRRQNRPDIPPPHASTAGRLGTESPPAAQMDALERGLGISGVLARQRCVGVCGALGLAVKTRYRIGW